MNFIEATKLAEIGENIFMIRRSNGFKIKTSLFLQSVDNPKIAWSPSVGDVLADDWYVVKGDNSDTSDDEWLVVDKEDTKYE